VRSDGGKYYGEFNGLEYPIQDDMAEIIYEEMEQSPAFRTGKRGIK
jgi:hypothetical protein